MERRSSIRTITNVFKAVSTAQVGSIRIEASLPKLPGSCPMSYRFLMLVCCCLTFVTSWTNAVADQSITPENRGCLQCHENKQTGFNQMHSFAANNCVICHSGNATATEREDAHSGMLSFPGDLSNAAETCGQCHADRVASVQANLMHTGHGMVKVTRNVVDGDTSTTATHDLQSLGHGAADSMLRKLCASCHLGQPKTEHQLDPQKDRGGGCLACHINDYPAEAHPSLTTQVSDARCFGCHSRSGRISLSYAGLAETDGTTESLASATLRLADGRRVERKTADVHYAAGMGCIDCHTSVDLMGSASNTQPQRTAVDIDCSDCHANTNRTMDADGTTIFATAKNNTPLQHIEVRADSAWLNTKTTGRVLKIPPLNATYHEDDTQHERLECSSCHSQWAPQCFGCHMEYEADGEQWDHVERRITAGRWNEQRSNIRNELPTLGVNVSNRIEAFVPGMIMTIAHPDWEGEKFARVFAPLSAHTIGPARSCESCHRSPVALGLGQGEFVEAAGKTTFIPAQPLLEDGLPADAWTNLDATAGGETPLPGQRSLNKEEMQSILRAPLP